MWANAWAREARNEAVWIPRVPSGKRIPEPRNGVLKGAEAFALEPRPSIEAKNQEKKKTIESVRSGMNLMAAVGSHWETAAFKLMPRQGVEAVNEQVPRNQRCGRTENVTMGKERKRSDWTQRKRGRSAHAAGMKWRRPKQKRKFFAEGLRATRVRGGSSAEVARRR